MERPYKSRRINTKVTEHDYRLLLSVVRTYGFRSVYQLVQTLLLCFIRCVDSQRDMQYEEGVGVEIEEMFKELMEPRVKRRGSYDKHHNFYEG